MVRGTFQPKDTAERISLPFDFTLDLGSETIVTATAAFAVDAGTDATPGNMANGSTVITGAIVSVPVKDGVAQVDYVVTCTATTSGSRVLVLAGLLPVRVA